jgi:hypothetical protein
LRCSHDIEREAEKSSGLKVIASDTSVREEMYC